jgi:hypothetical protein
MSIYTHIKIPTSTDFFSRTFQRHLFEINNMKKIVTLSALCISTIAGAQTPQVLKDIHPSTSNTTLLEGAMPYFSVVNNKLF